jgi:hypothetical protein
VDPSAQNNETIITAVKFNHLNIVKLLLKNERVDPSSQNNTAIIIALIAGYLDVAEVLLEDKRVDPSAKNNKSFIGASSNNKPETIKFLLKDKRIDPAAQNNKAFIEASRNGHILIVELLLKDNRIDPATQNNKAFIEAVINNQVETVKLLLKDKRVNPAAQDNIAIIHAFIHGNLDMAKLLLTDERVDPSAQHNKALISVMDSSRYFLPKTIGTFQYEAFVLLIHQEQVLDKLIYEPIQNQKLRSYTGYLAANSYNRYRGLLLAFYLVNKNPAYPALLFYRNSNLSPMEAFYKDLLARLLFIERPMISVVKFIKRLFDKYSIYNDIRTDIHMATENTLHSTTIMKYKGGIIYYAIRGLLLLSFIPSYRLVNIYDILRSEGASNIDLSMAAQIIGAYIGLEVMEKTMSISDDIWLYISKAPISNANIYFELQQ